MDSDIEFDIDDNLEDVSLNEVEDALDKGEPGFEGKIGFHEDGTPYEKEY